MREPLKDCVLLARTRSCLKLKRPAILFWKVENTKTEAACAVPISMPVIDTQSGLNNAERVAVETHWTESVHIIPPGCSYPNQTMLESHWWKFMMHLSRHTTTFRCVQSFNNARNQIHKHMHTHTRIHMCTHTNTYKLLNFLCTTQYQVLEDWEFLRHSIKNSP